MTFALLAATFHRSTYFEYFASFMDKWKNEDAATFYEQYVALNKLRSNDSNEFSIETRLNDKF